MKFLIHSITILVLFTSCAQNDLSDLQKESQFNSSLAKVEYSGPIAADGCGWLLDYNSKFYKSYDLPESLHINDLYINATFQGGKEFFQCSFGSIIPEIEILDLPDNLIQFYKIETQCSDPWTWTSDSDEGRIRGMINYLNENSIHASALKINGDLWEGPICAACSCGTGRSFSIWVDENQIEEMAKLDFTQMACTMPNPIEDIGWLKELKQQFDMDDTPEIIMQAEYQDQCLFIVDSCFQCPDALTYAYDEDKNVICEFGGIDGRNTCPGFQPTNVIWLYSSNN